MRTKRRNDGRIQDRFADVRMRDHHDASISSDGVLGCVDIAEVDGAFVTSQNELKS